MAMTTWMGSTKLSQAMLAYTPICTKIFGCSTTRLAMKITFLFALVLSRLLFNVHTRVPSVRYLAQLNSTYMRVVCAGANEAWAWMRH